MSTWDLASSIKARIGSPTPPSPEQFFICLYSPTNFNKDNVQVGACMTAVVLLSSCLWCQAGQYFVCVCVCFGSQGTIEQNWGTILSHSTGNIIRKFQYVSLSSKLCAKILSPQGSVFYFVELKCALPCFEMSLSKSITQTSKVLAFQTVIKFLINGTDYWIALKIWQQVKAKLSERSLDIRRQWHFEKQNRWHRKLHL